jgi:hypothetical protein
VILFPSAEAKCSIPDIRWSDDVDEPVDTPDVAALVVVFVRNFSINYFLRIGGRVAV